MKTLSWKELYNKQNRPPRNSLDIFWTKETKNLFDTFSSELKRRYDLSLTHLNYSVTNGWKFKFSKLNIVLIKNIIILNDGFIVDDIIVKNEEDITTALNYVETLYTDEFLAMFEERRKARNKSQVERAKRFVERNKNKYNAFIAENGIYKVNKFKWEPKVPQNYLIRLYKSDANMMRDTELLEEVGFGFYIRCLQGRDERILANEGKLKCHHCGKILQIKSNDDLLICDCGYAYIFREYMRSFNRNGMPSRSATPFFNEYIDKWPLAKTDYDKMKLIDWLIHECHLNMYSGVKRGFAGRNLIDGKNVGELILLLAYGDVT